MSSEYNRNELEKHVGASFNTLENHNETDFESFNKFSESIDSKFEEVEKQKSIELRKNRLSIWDERTPKRWYKASLAHVDKNISEKVMTLLKEDKTGSFFITGSANKDKNYHAYAIIRRLIGAGQLAPSRVKIISEDEILNYALTGFEGRAKIEDLVENDYEAFIIDNIGSKEYYDAKREIPVLEQIINHIYKESIPTIFVSNVALDSFTDALSPAIEEKLYSMLQDRQICIGSSFKKTKEVPKRSILDSFSD